MYQDVIEVSCEVFMKFTIKNINAIITQKIIVQPITDSGIRRMKLWLMEENWECVTEAPTADLKAEAFQDTFVTKFDQYFPKKNVKTE